MSTRYFFYSFNLLRIVKEKRIGIDSKLDFLRKAGIFNSRSLSRLNTIRNKMEHEFETPKIQNLEVYYDLVSAFASVLESVTIALNFYSEISYNFYIEYGPQGKFNIIYNFDIPSIKIEYSLYHNGIESNEIFEVNVYDFNDFTYFFKILFLLYQSEGIVNKSYVLEQLEIIDK